jgi:stringent starvation protein B
MNSLFKSANNLLKNKASVYFLKRSFGMLSTRINVPKAHKSSFYKFDQKNFWKKKPESEKKEEKNDKTEQKEDNQINTENQKNEGKKEEDDHKPHKGSEKLNKNNSDEEPNKSIIN